MSGLFFPFYHSHRKEVKYPAASCGVFDSRGSRQMDMQACPLGSLPAEIKLIRRKMKICRTKAARGGGRCVCGGRLRGCGKSKRSTAPPDEHRSDSTGIVYQFPSQRSSDSGFVTLRLSRPPALRSAKIFSHPRRCPLHTQRPPPLAAFVLQIFNSYFASSFKRIAKVKFSSSRRYSFLNSGPQLLEPMPLWQ